MLQIFEFFGLTFRFNSSRYFGIIKDELIFTLLFYLFENSWQIKKFNFNNYLQRVNL